MKVIVPMSDSPITPPDNKKSFKTKTYNPEDVSHLKRKQSFLRNMQQLFGFRQVRKSKGYFNGSYPIEFVKLDPEHQFSVAQGKLGKVVDTHLSSSLEELLKVWLNDTTTTVETLKNRFLRISELEFAINNDPFIGKTAALQADEACQLDQHDVLINIECENLLMKKRMEDLLVQWGVTQSRVRTTIWQLGAFGDAFWANKITEDGVVRIHPLDCRQILERLEFNPMRTLSDMNIKDGAYLVNQITKSQYLSLLLDNMASEDADEFCDLFDSKLFGFVVGKDKVVPGWAVTHFRVDHEISEFFPFGKSPLLQSLAPFKQANATMSLQAIARIANMPIIYYGVDTPKGADVMRQWEYVNKVRAQVENYGETGNPTETYSVNTKIWGAKDVLDIKAISPNISIDSIGDINFYQDRVAISTGVPKGYLMTDWGQWGVSGISLVEQHKPFSRKVYSLQSAFLEGLASLFRIHFAITGEFNYFEPFTLSMNFPNSESSNDRIQAKQSSLDLAKSVIDTVSQIIASLNDPLPPEIIEDILSKYSFLSRKDLEKWLNIKSLQTIGAIKKTDTMPDESGGEEDFGSDFGLGGSSGGSFGGGGESLGMGAEEIGGEENAEIPEEGGEGATEEEKPIPSQPNIPANESFYYKALSHLTEKRKKELIVRYKNLKEEVDKNISKQFLSYAKKMSEGVINNRHYMYNVISQDLSQGSMTELSAILKTCTMIGKNIKRKNKLTEETILTSEKHLKVLKSMGLLTETEEINESGEKKMSTNLQEIFQSMKNQTKLMESDDSFSLEQTLMPHDFDGDETI